LKHLLHDTAPDVQHAAVDAIPKLRNVDGAVVDLLLAAVNGPSTSMAWAAAQLLGTIDQNPSTPIPIRRRIISTLTDAVYDPRSNRTVQFTYTDVSIPDLPS
jgi:hypothetical protein